MIKYVNNYLLFDGRLFKLLVEVGKVQFAAFFRLYRSEFIVILKELVSLPNLIGSLKHIDPITLLLTTPLKLLFLVQVALGRGVILTELFPCGGTSNGREWTLIVLRLLVNDVNRSIRSGNNCFSLLIKTRTSS